MIKLYYTFTPIESEEFIKKALEKFSGTTDFDIKRTENGKPYVDDKIFFSLSHSSSLTICAVSNENIGADAEKVRSINNKEKILQKFLSDTKCCSDEEFFQKWTSFESRVKYFGEKITACPQALSKTLFVQTIKLDEYIIAICSKSKKQIKKEIL